MTALTTNRVNTTTLIKRMQFTLAAGQHCYKGSEIAVTLGAGTCVVVTATTGIYPLGHAAEEVDATSAAQLVTVEFAQEIACFWQSNHTVSAVAATDIGYLCYWQDDQAVTMATSGRVIAGRVIAVDATKGVLIQELGVGTELATALATVMKLATGATLAFTAGALAPATITSGALYDCPATDQASTITLPTASAYGVWCVFQADGTVNDFTVKFADAALGAIALKMPASIPWQVFCVKGTDGWHITPLVNSGKPFTVAVPALTSTDMIMTEDMIVNGANYLITGSLGTNATVTLATTNVADYTRILFIADGTQGAYTVTYRYGTTAITTALTASKAHMCDLVKIGSKWFANAYIAP